MILHVSDREFALILEALVEKPCPYQVMMPLIASLMAQRQKVEQEMKMEQERKFLAGEMPKGLDE